MRQRAGHRLTWARDSGYWLLGLEVAVVEAQPRGAVLRPQIGIDAPTTSLTDCGVT
jgi:hypothetical protein